MRLRPAAIAATSVLSAGAAAVAAGRYAAAAALRPARVPSPEGRVPLPAGFGGPPLTVHAVRDGSIAVTRSLSAQLPGTYALTGRDCHAVVGPVLEEESALSRADTVVRRLERVSRGEPVPGSKLWLTPQVCTGGPEDAPGVERTEIEIPGELGPLPAWFAPGYRTTWVITLHGLGATREQGLALLPAYARQRFPVLGLAHRGDPGAPRHSEDVRHLGDTEWRDVASAIRYAVAHGAERVVLHGWSSGATMALRAEAELSARQSASGSAGSRPEPADRALGRISGLVLDSPVLEWTGTLRALAASRRTPRPLLPLVVRAAQGRAGVGPERLDRVVDPAALRVPTLLLHGPEDTIASWQASQEFAAAREELVSLHPVPSAPHAAMWNADPAGYEETLRRFLTPLM